MARTTRTASGSRNIPSHHEKVDSDYAPDLSIFAVRCIKSGTFGQVVFSAPNEPTAVRSVAMGMARDPNNELNTFPGDYELWRLADYDSHTGEVIAVPRMVSPIAVIKDMIRDREAPNGGA